MNYIEGNILLGFETEFNIMRRINAGKFPLLELHN